MGCRIGQFLIITPLRLVRVFRMATDVDRVSSSFFGDWPADSNRCSGLVDVPVPGVTLCPVMDAILILVVGSLVTIGFRKHICDGILLVGRIDLAIKVEDFITGLGVFRVISDRVVPLHACLTLLGIPVRLIAQIADINTLVENLQARQEMALKEMLVAEGKSAHVILSSNVLRLNNIVAAPAKIRNRWTCVAVNHFTPKQTVVALAGGHRRRLGRLSLQLLGPEVMIKLTTNVLISLLPNIGWGVSWLFRVC
ncbi:hypothetical protein HDV63DRAFT_379392 [Trichoderma sp. SZMC 28014]